MDKADFIRIAPQYYELAVLVAVWTKDGHLSEDSFRSAYEVDHDGNDAETLLSSEAMLASALRSLIAKNVIEVLEDPFGPALYTRAGGISQYIEKAEADRTSPFHKSSRAPHREAWIFNALAKLARMYRDLDIKEADFANPDEEWEPIALDRNSGVLAKTIEAVDQTKRLVEESNGYNSQHPEERKYVLDNLRMLSETLKTASVTSIGYLKHHGVAVLGKLQARFGEALIGESAKESAKWLWALIKEAVKAAL